MTGCVCVCKCEGKGREKTVERYSSANRINVLSLFLQHYKNENLRFVFHAL